MRRSTLAVVAAALFSSVFLAAATAPAIFVFAADKCKAEIRNNGVDFDARCKNLSCEQACTHASGTVVVGQQEWNWAECQCGSEQAFCKARVLWPVGGGGKTLQCIDNGCEDVEGMECDEDHDEEWPEGEGWPYDWHNACACKGPGPTI